MRSRKNFAAALVSALLACLISSSARADYYLEPYLGYELGGYQMRNAAVANGTIRGADFGARAGFKILDTFFLALDGMYGRKDDAANSPSSPYDGSIEHKALGATAGLSLPVLARVWVGYNWMDQFEYSTEPNSQYSGFLLKGSSTKFGLGLSPLPFFSFNVEYFIYNHKKIGWSGGSLSGREEDLANTSLGDLRRDHSAVMFSVSLPLSL